MTEDDLFPAMLAAKLKRLFHRAQADVFLADLRTRLAIDIAPHQHRRARGNTAQRFQPGNRLKIVGQTQILSRLKALEHAAQFQDTVGSDRHIALLS